LTLALGHRSVAEAQRWISSREFGEWLAYDRISPIGPERQDWHAALLASTFANAFRGKNRAPFRIKDFMPQFDGGHRRRTVEEIQADMMMYARRHNKRLARERKGGD